MDIAKEKAKLKRMEAIADNCIALATQLLNTATHLKSEATTAQMELGDSKGTGRKAQFELGEAETARLRGQITGRRLNATRA